MHNSAIRVQKSNGHEQTRSKSNPDTRHRPEFLKATESSVFCHQHEVELYVTSLLQDLLERSGLSLGESVSVECVCVFLYLSNLHQRFVHIDSSVAILQICLGQFVLLYKLCIEVPNRGGKKKSLHKQRQTNTNRTASHNIWVKRRRQDEDKRQKKNIL